MPPDDDESIPRYTPTAVGNVVFVVVTEHDMGPHVILLAVRVELFNVRDGEAFPLTCILKSLLVTAS